MAARWLVGLLASTVAFATLAQEKIFVQVPAEYDPYLKLPEEKKKACDAARVLGQQVLEQVRIWIPGAAAESGAGPATGLRLRLLVTGLDGHGEGSVDPLTSSLWSISMRAELFDGSAAVAAKVLRRRSMAGHPSNCDATNKIARVLGNDVSQWLRQTLPSAKPQ